MSSEMMRQFEERYRQLQADGLSFGHAIGVASLEMRLEQWPAAWGQELIAVLYGDFDPPESQITVSRLAVIIEADKLPDAAAGGSRTKVRARVAVTDRTVASVKDAVRRLNILVAAISAMNNGAPIRWWCWLIHSGGASVRYKLENLDIDALLQLLDLLAEPLRKKVAAALYWVREPRGMLHESYRSDHFQVFAGYWNAFELLVDVAAKLWPPAKLSRSDKLDAIATRLREAGEAVTPEDISKLYREVVDRGFRAKAEHILRTCCGPEAEEYIIQCFVTGPTSRSLYSIRNAIDHGTIDLDDPEALIVVEDRFSVLAQIVWVLLRAVLWANATAQGKDGTAAFRL